MSGQSYLRSAISSFIAKEIEGVEVLAFDTVGEATKLTTEHLAAINLILIHCRDDKRNHHDLSEDVAEMRSLLKDVPIVLFGDSNECHGTKKALEVGAKGYIPESTPAEIVKHALPLVAVGGVFLPISTISKVTGQNPAAPEQKKPLAPIRLERNQVGTKTIDLATDEFTEREIDVLKLLSNGLQNKLIAYELGLKEGTVKVHVRHIMKKLKATSRTQAALYAQRLFSQHEFSPTQPSDLPPDER